MKYSADDIAHQTFEKRFRGYDPDQVHEFLQGMAREWDYMSGELMRLQDEVAQQAVELRACRAREGGLLDALNTAREVADEIAAKAQARGDRIVEEASLKAEQLLVSAQRERELCSESLERLHRQRASLAEQLGGVLDAHQSLLREHLGAQPQEPQAPGPLIHRRPRPQPCDPARRPKREDPALDLASPTALIDDAESETLLAILPHEGP